MNRFQKILVIAVVGLFVMPFVGAQADVVGERHTFYVDSNYDVSGRTSLSATLVGLGEHIYVYIEDSILNQYGGSQAPAIASRVSQMISTFDQEIYPSLTNFWGSEPKPGIDNDPHVTILFEKMARNTGGYFDSSNLFLSRPSDLSNEREMITISTDTLFNDQAKVFIAHEFHHLISANQKILINHTSEDIWLDELRAQYSITVAGYNTPFAGSDLRSRLQSFLSEPTDSLTEWQGKALDYAPVSLFGQYLVEHYGAGIITDTLKSSLTGISSIDAWLVQNKYSERFADLFKNWLVANYINQTSVDSRFGYKDPNLAQIRVAPSNTLQLEYTDSKFTFSEEPWQPEWYKFILPGNIPPDQNLRISWSAPSVSMLYADDQGHVVPITNGGIIARVPGILSFTLMPASPDKSPLADLNIGFTTEPPTSLKVNDGTLIHRQGESEIYVVEGKYRRYLLPGTIALYGHLDPSKAVSVSSTTFNSYSTSNYIRVVDEEKVYTVWPDGTKHWLNISAKVFSETGRDWNSIFIINKLEADSYKTGPDITR